MRSTENTSTPIKKKRGDIAVFVVIVASILGSVYGIYNNIGDLECTTAIYMWMNSSANELTFMMVFGIWLKYFKKIFIVWICSFYKSTHVICYIILFGVVFSVGFTSISLLLLWDKSNAVLLLICCLIEALITIGMIIKIIIRKNSVINKKKYIRNNIDFLIIIIIMTTLLTLFNTCATNIIIL